MIDEKKSGREDFYCLLLLDVMFKCCIRYKVDYFLILYSGV